MRNTKTGAPAKQAMLRGAKALASPVRLTILEYLKDPEAHFPPQVDGHLLKDGVCADFIREKLGIAAATASQHLKVLCDAGFLIPTRRKQWTFYRRNERALRDLGRTIRSEA